MPSDLLYITYFKVTVVLLFFTDHAILGNVPGVLTFCSFSATGNISFDGTNRAVSKPIRKCQFLK